MRQEGEVTPPQAAQMLQLNPVTVREWVKAALAGKPSRIPRAAIRRDVAGRYYVQKDTIQQLRDTEGT